MPIDLLKEARTKREPVNLLSGRSISDTINQNTIQKDKEKSLAEKAQGLAGGMAKFGYDVAQGAKKGVASTFTGLASLPQQAGRALAEKITGKPAPKEFQTVREMADKTGMLERKGTGEAVGFGVEQVGEMFIPVGAGKTATSIASKLPIKGSAGKVIASTVAKAVGEGMEYGSKTFVQTGDEKKAKEAAVIAATIPIVGQIVKSTGKAIAQKAIPLSAKEAKYVQAYKAKTYFWDRIGGNIKEPTTAGKTAFEKGLTGTESGIGVKAKRTADNLWKNMLEPKLKTSTAKVNMSSLFDDAEKEIINKNPELSRQKDLLEALKSLREDYAKVGDVDMMTLQNFKKGWATFVPEKAYKGKPIAGAFNEIKNTVSGVARKKIYEALGPEAKKAYIDWGNLQGLQELGQKAMTGGKLKGGFGGFWSAIKDMALTPVMTMGGKVIYRTGQGIELIGTKGAKNIADLFPSPESK